MAARKPHHKSRSGCTECKRRRIKCDEGRPDCDNCRKRNVMCSFHIFDPASRQSPTSGTAGDKVSSRVHVFPQKPDDSSNDLPVHGLLDSKAQAALLEDFPAASQAHFLSILQHFATHTISTLSSGSAAQAAWQEALPALASAHKFVTHGMLAIASLHLSRLCDKEEEQKMYEKLAATQMNTGIVQYRNEVQNVTTKNAEALFAFSTTITAFVLFTAGAECKSTLKSMENRDISKEESANSISKLVYATCRIFRSIRGVLVIIVPCWDHIQSGALGPVVKRDWWPMPIPATPEQIEDDQRLQALEKMWSRPARTYEYSFDTLRSALKNLRESFALVSGLTRLPQLGSAVGSAPFDWTTVIQWPVHLSQDFLSLLEERRTEAWVLLAHYAILPAKFTGILWMDGLATNLIATAALVIGEEEWNWITWPAVVVGVDLNRLRNLSIASLQPLNSKRESSTERTPTPISVDLSYL